MEEQERSGLAAAPRDGGDARRTVRWRSTWQAAILGAGFVFLGPAAWAWGPAAQQAVVGRAIETLPKGLKSFYKTHRLEVPSLALEPTFPEEGPERRFMIDRVMPWPFAELPHSEKDFQAKYGDQAASLGRLPWLLQESFGRLVEAFKASDKVKILNESDTLALLVADLHNPLTLTDNADGQKTGQHGLWIRTSVKLVEAMKDRLKVEPDAARYLDNPREYVFSMIEASYVWLDNLLYADALAKRGKQGYGEIFFESFEIRAGRIVGDRLSRAAEDAGSYWYTAWTVAGRPELK
jgi:hypothetical protein